MDAPYSPTGPLAMGCHMSAACMHAVRCYLQWMDEQLSLFYRLRADERMDGEWPEQETDPSMVFDEPDDQAQDSQDPRVRVPNLERSRDYGVRELYDDEETNVV